MTRSDAALRISMTLMQCGMMMPIDWVNSNGEGSETMEAFRLALDIINPKPDSNGLLPCPYCGKPAELKAERHVPQGTDYIPRCTDPSCCGRLTKKFSSKEKAIGVWNMRGGHE